MKRKELVRDAPQICVTAAWFFSWWTSWAWCWVEHTEGSISPPNCSPGGHTCTFNSQVQQLFLPLCYFYEEHRRSSWAPCWIPLHCLSWDNSPSLLVIQVPQPYTLEFTSLRWDKVMPVKCPVWHLLNTMWCVSFCILTSRFLLPGALWRCFSWHHTVIRFPSHSLPSLQCSEFYPLPGHISSRNNTKNITYSGYFLLSPKYALTFRSTK